MTHNSLPPSVGKYSIDRKIGAGGFGDVYLATDVELNRPVAIKVVRSDADASSTLGPRFRREAEVLARIDHPFICKVYELVDLEDQSLLVMEYVEGQTLASLLRAGPLGIERTLRIAGELAEALGFAHAAGVIHRDIKPANVMITHNDHVKLMDFGLAKRVEPVSGDGTTALTAAGSLFGTLQYMSPEQATGSEVDGKSDVFSFGVILYQCLSGKLPYESESRQEYYANLLADRRDALSDEVPERIRDAVDLCLKSDPDQRIGSFDEIRRWLGDGTSSLRSLPPTRPEAAQRSRSGLFAGAAVTVAALGVLAIWMVGGETPAPALPDLFQEAFVTWPTDETSARLSPDASTVVFVSDRGGEERLWLRSADGDEARPITDDVEGLKYPVWSPDGRQIAYLLRDGGGAKLQVASAFGASIESAVWVHDEYYETRLVRWLGTDIYLLIARSLWRLDTATGELSSVFESTAETGIQTADIHPDASRIVFSVTEGTQQDLWTVDLADGTPVQLTDTPSSEHGPTFVGTSAAAVYLSNEGGQMDVWEIDIGTGERRPLTSSPQEESSVHVSADGRALITTVLRDESDLWIGHPVDARAAQLTGDSLKDFWPSGAADSDRIVFHRSRPSLDGTHALLDSQLMLSSSAALGADEPRRVVLGGYRATLSADGRWLAFLRPDPETGPRPNVWARDLNREQEIMVAEAYALPGFLEFPLHWTRSNMTWSDTAPRLFYVVVDDARTPRIEYVDLTAGLGDGIDGLEHHVVFDNAPGWVLQDVHLSASESSLAFIARDPDTRRRSLVRLDLATSSPDIIYSEEVADDLYLRGWRSSESLVAVRSTRRQDTGFDCRVVAITTGGVVEELASMVATHCTNIAIDIARGRAFYSTVVDGIHNLTTTAFAGSNSIQLTGNTLPGVTFAAPWVLANGDVLFARQETHHDLWLSRIDQ